MSLAFVVSQRRCLLVPGTEQSHSLFRQVPPERAGHGRVTTSPGHIAESSRNGAVLPRQSVLYPPVG